MPAVYIPLEVCFPFCFSFISDKSLSSINTLTLYKQSHHSFPSIQPPFATVRGLPLDWYLLPSARCVNSPRPLLPLHRLLLPLARWVSSPRPLLPLHRFLLPSARWVSSLRPLLPVVEWATSTTPRLPSSLERRWNLHGVSLGA